jgi:hypothetical protein
MIKYLLSVSLLIALGLINGCGIYSLSGASIDYEQTKTISIQNMYNDATLGPVNMHQTLTNKLRDYYQQNTNLVLVGDNEEGDLQIEGGVVSFRTSPMAPQSAGSRDTAALTRLTISLKISYINTKDDKYNFENKSFSWYSDFDSNQNLTTLENQLIEEIFDKITLDIFNASVANW